MSGCRSYGGYGSEEVLYQQTERMVQRFAEDLERVRGDLAALEQAASEDPRFAVLAERFALLIEGQEAVLDEQQSLLAELSPRSTYRSLHRAHGAIMAAQRTIHVQREGLLRDFSEVPGDTLSQVESDRPYALIPPYYDRIISRKGDLSVSDLVRRARTDGAIPMGSSAETGAGQASSEAGEGQEAAADNVEMEAETAAPADG